MLRFSTTNTCILEHNYLPLTSIVTIMRTPNNNSVTLRFNKIVKGKKGVKEHFANSCEKRMFNHYY